MSRPNPSNDHDPFGCAENWPDPGTPHSARVWDYWLGGKNHYAADRALGDRVLAAVPHQRLQVRAHREFLVRAVEFLVAEAGVRQIVDVGAGLPASPAVHEIAQAIAPETRVVYVDNDPVVMAHARALTTTRELGGVAFLRGDLRAPRDVLAGLAGVLDLAAPVAVLLLATLMFVVDDDRPEHAVRDFMAPLAAGSYVALTHATADFAPREMAEQSRMAADCGLRFVPRSAAQLRSIVAPPLRLVSPGLVPVQRWRPRGIDPPRRAEAHTYAAVARKP